MSVPLDKNWPKEFGIDDGERIFFTSEAELNAAKADTSQVHVLRRAFELLYLDGILCTQNAPLVYFKEMKTIETAEVSRLHRKFWNHGGAPILVLVAPNDVHIYSGLVRPVSTADGGRIPSLVETLDRASSALREFLPAVESGEFFRRNQASFNPAHRVDRDLLDNLQGTRDSLVAASAGKLSANVLDALLCRLVFACYLFDREVVGEAYMRDIGLRGVRHLRDVLQLRPRAEAKKYLYALFNKLGDDFNGDLFSDDLRAEAELVSASYIDPLDHFFRATDVRTGQGSFWPYDFAAIPVEAISAIYERFLKSSDKRQGAFYTPRFLAELVIDVALGTTQRLLDQRFLDPACGSGIFLVGLFNRMAEEWKQAHPGARNDRRARELRKLLTISLCGVDINPTACRITAFSLYLAYLDQLSPRDIQELQEKGHKLPRLVHYPIEAVPSDIEGNIWCGDFFESTECPVDADLVIGNPPWGSTAIEDTPAAKWCAEHEYPIPNKQIAVAFVWKAGQHVRDRGRICLVLPHGILFNHSTTALEFQRAFFTRRAVDRVLNLADYQRFLFEEAGHPALVIAYQSKPPDSPQHVIEYWAPKVDWLITRAEVIAVMPEDRSTLSVGQVLKDLDGRDAPQIWKQRYWATPRDWRFIDRLSLYPRLRDHVRRAREKAEDKPWVMAEGFQPVGPSDDPTKAEVVQLPSTLFIEATSPKVDLFLLPGDCITLPRPHVTMRSGSNKSTNIFQAPHVLVTKGFTGIAFADFDVSFRHALRGIRGPQEDRDMLVFLAAYLRSSLARYFLFQTSSNWGVSRQEVHVEELLRLPFPLPGAMPSPARAWNIVKEVAQIVTGAAAEATTDWADRVGIIQVATDSIEILVEEYFDIIPVEKTLLDDATNIIIPSVRPTRRRPVVPTISPSRQKQRDEYITRLCDTLNGWSKSGPFAVHGHAMVSPQLGIGVAVLQKIRSGEMMPKPAQESVDILTALNHLRDVAARKFSTFELVRGAKVFDRDRLYVVKPIGQRFWTQTAALNDADEIAGTILMHTPQGIT